MDSCVELFRSAKAEERQVTFQFIKMAMLVSQYAVSSSKHVRGTQCPVCMNLQACDGCVVQSQQLQP